MQGIKRHIANIITLGNMFCGLLAILFSIDGNLYLSGICIFIGALLDFFDGFSARLFKTTSEFGKQLDSLADIITFGVAPGFILFQLIYYSLEISLYSSSSNIYSYNSYFFSNDSWKISLIGFLIPIFSAIRLAKFNLNKENTYYFTGLPTPAAAIFIASLPIIMYHKPDSFIETYNLIGISIILSLLLISEIPLFSLKINKNLRNKNTKLYLIQVLFLISCIILLYFLQVIAIPFIVVLYIFLSIINNLIQ